MKNSDVRGGVMSRKRIIGMVVCLVGVVLSIIAIYAMSRISSAKGNIKTAEGWVPSSAYKDVGSKELSKQASQYDAKVTGLLIGGIVLAVAGCGIAIRGRKGKQKGK